VYRESVSLYILGEIIEWRIEVFSHDDETPCIASLSALVGRRDGNKLHRMAVIARDYHALPAHSGIYELGQMALGLFGTDWLHSNLPLRCLAAEYLPAQYSNESRCSPPFAQVMLCHAMSYNARTST
jgi:hypothetical protein